MRSFRDYLTDKVETIAIECGFEVFQAAEWGDCGWWIFKDDSGTTKAKLYYFFEEDYCSVREGKSLLHPGIKCYYGDDSDEKKLVEYIKEKLPLVMSLESKLADASKRSIENNAAAGKSLNFEKEYEG